ncbi:unnamed protein product [Zymoseptoria tritici ST99CH_1E4]|uniref:Transcription factor domain-containing protein n=1 Tax=Zymoseptoria tritici ST99CH_1E4 TaxID=1276532 RepID=A0A2H1FLR2_ZYMTR|nr:unnamed protein product [Zymoseptoria tritici ST99CH_1E4]
MELEAQVEALTALLQAQGIQDPASLAEDLVPAWTGSNPRKRRLVNGGPPSASVSVTTVQTAHTPTDLEPMTLDLLDANITYDGQQQLLDRYIEEQVPALPLIPLPSDTTLDWLRAEKPMLLYAVVYAAGPGMLDVDVQERVALPLLDRMARYRAREDSGGASASVVMEALLSMQIASLWYRSPKRHVDPLNVFRLLESASEFASRLGGEDMATQSIDGIDSSEIWRSRLVSYLLGSAMAIFGRKKSAIEWTHDHNLCLVQLQYSPLSKPSDPWLSQLVRAERLCDQVAEQMDLFKPEVYTDLTEPAMKLRVQNCRNKILNWRMTVPRSLRTPTLLFWEHMATVLMHEPVLYTPSNGRTWTAPYLSETFSVTDFPAPSTVTEEHITAIFELTTAAQGMLEIILAFDTRTLLALPGLLFTPRAAYALSILAKLYIAVSAPGSTLGVTIDGSMLLVGEYADKMIAAGKACRDIDERCVPARIMFAAISIKEWYLNFSGILSETADVNAPGTASLQPLNKLQPITPFAEIPSAIDATLDERPNDWNAYLQYGVGDNADFGFDMLFAGSASYEDMCNIDISSYL